MISRELLSEVMKIPNLDYEISNNKKEIHFGNIETSISEFINIYELSHKCKEWAYNLDEQLTIKSYTVRNAGVCEVKDKIGIHIETFDDLTEVKAIFKACEWILKEGN